LINCGGVIAEQVLSVVVEKVVGMDLDWEYFVESYKGLEIKGKEIEIVI